MQIISPNQFPQAFSGARSFLAIQKVWERHPELRPQVAAGLKKLCRSVNRAVSRAGLQR